MKFLFNQNKCFQIHNKEGAVAIYVAVTITVFLGVAALAVDAGYMMAGKSELQRTADAAALAATRQLGQIYGCANNAFPCEAMNYEDQQTYNASADAPLIQMAAIDVASKNKAAGINVTMDSADVEIGVWNPQANPQFTPTLDQPDAVRATARRDGTTNGPINTFLARILGINNTNVRATAVAALTGESSTAEGGLPIPIGIPTRWFQNPNFCNSSINFYPPCNKEPCTSAEGCAGYHTYEDWPASASFLAKTIMPGIPTGAYQSPDTTAGQTSFNFTGGTLANLMNPPDYPFITLFDIMKVRNDGITDLDTNSSTWTAKVIVYDSNSCANPNQSQQIMGYTTIVIENVVGAPNPTVQGRVLCDNVQWGRGGGGEYGTKGVIPGLVQ